MSEMKFSTEGKKNQGGFKTNYVWLGIIGFIVIVILFNCFTIVEQGFVGVKSQFGKVVDANMKPGLNFHIPFVEKIISVDVRNQTYTFEGDAYTKDTQNVQSLKLRVTYQYEQSQLFNLIDQIGIENVENRFLVPNVQKISKNAIGKVNAEDLVQTRETIQSTIKSELYNALVNDGIIVTDFAIENLAFSSAFEDSIQAKVIAAQDALKMQNKTVEKEEEAKQVVIAAQAKADSTVLEAEAEAKAIALIQEQIASNPVYIDYLKIVNWNGTLPQVIGDGVNPFVVLDGADYNNVPAINNNSNASNNTGLETNRTGD